MTDLIALLNEMESLGTAQNRKIYARHGAKEPMYGLSTANLKVLAKRIKINHELALALWQTGNYDARNLATIVADPKQATDDLLEAWVKDVDGYPITDAFVGYVSKTSFVQAKAEAWFNHTHEWISSAGWGLMGHLASSSSLPDSYFSDLLQTIETTIHTRPNRVRYNMNMVLINIGLRNASLEEQAMTVASHIGVVEVDHGETSCETPDAVHYIQKTKAYRESKAKQKA